MGTSTLEVEMKFPLPDGEWVLRLLNERGAIWRELLEQIDEYLAHPVRDFARTDEAFRIRSVGIENCLTYKGPKLDAETKTRREIEVTFATGNEAREQMRELVLALGFKSVACVRKERQTGNISWLGLEIELALDQVEGAGNFLELEICTAAEHMPAAKAAILDLAAELQLGPCERRSYLELCLQH